MSGWTLVLVLWTSFSLVWWLISFLLARGSRPPAAAAAAWCQSPGARDRAIEPIDRRRLSIFKPMAAPRSRRERERLLESIGSFAAQLDEHSELLVGVTAGDWPQVSSLVEELRNRHPNAELKLVVDALADQYPNRKMALNKALARHATGALWLWSDADITAPPDTLTSLRRDIAAGDAAFVASPYVIADVEHSPEVLDKLFVNVEFHPGVVLLDRLSQIRFGFGSGMLFEASLFHRRADWDFLGTSLADDYHLGRLLGAGRLASTQLITMGSAADWRAAILHYLRWHKTIRWCRPAPYAAQLLVLPIVGWLAAVLAAPEESVAWLGLAAVLALDTVGACAICGALGAPLRRRDVPAAVTWSLLRGIVWVSCWFPWPIVWRGRRWWTARATGVTPRDELHPGRPPWA